MARYHSLIAVGSALSWVFLFCQIAMSEGSAGVYARVVEARADKRLAQSAVSEAEKALNEAKAQALAELERTSAYQQAVEAVANADASLRSARDAAQRAPAEEALTAAKSKVAYIKIAILETEAIQTLAAKAKATRATAGSGRRVHRG